MSEERDITPSIYTIDKKDLGPLADYAPLYLAYIHSTESLEKIARKMGYRPYVAVKCAVDQRWVEDRRANREAIMREAHALINQSGVRQIQAIQSRHARNLQKQIDRIDRVLDKMTEEPDQTKETLQAIRTYAEARSRLYADQRKALGIADEIHVAHDINSLIPAKGRQDILSRYARQDDDGGTLDEVTDADFQIIDAPDNPELTGCDITPPHGQSTPPPADDNPTPSPHNAQKSISLPDGYDHLMETMEPGKGPYIPGAIPDEIRHLEE